MDSNLYGYVLQNPVSGIDPSGLVLLVDDAIIIGIGALATWAVYEITPHLERLGSAIGQDIDDWWTTLPPLTMPDWMEMSAHGNVADTAISQALQKEGTGGRNRCDWLKDNASRFPKKSVKMTEKAWGCRHSRASKDKCKK